MIQSQERNIVIDSGPDFRYQMLREGVKHLDAIVFTHEHKDHIAGLDDIRAFNYRQKSAIDVYASLRVQEALKKEFSYIFQENAYPGIPKINLKTIPNHSFNIHGIPFMPIEVMHHKLPVWGFRVGDFTYITDAKTISEQERNKIYGTKVLVLNALQKEAHISHLTLSEAIAFAGDINADMTYFTHVSHRLGTHQTISAALPPKIQLAYDGLKLLI